MEEGFVFLCLISVVNHSFKKKTEKIGGLGKNCS